MSVAAVALIASKTLEVNMRGATIKKQRLSYSVKFKLGAVFYAEIYGNRATARYIGVNEKQIRDWRSKKHHLVHSESTAKRLKGAAKHRSTNQIVAKDHKDCEIDTYKRYLTNYLPLDTESSEEQRTKVLSYLLDISTTKLEISESAYQYRRIDLMSTDSNEKTRDMERLDYHERFSCALALLDLKKGC